MRGYATGCRNWLDIVNAAAVVVISAAHQNAELLIREEPPADGAAHLVDFAAADDRCISADAVKSDCWGIAGRFGHQVYRSANAVTVDVGLQRLVDLNRIHQV